MMGEFVRKIMSAIDGGLVFGCVFFFQAEDGIRDDLVTGVQTCALPILMLKVVLWRWIGMGGSSVSAACYQPLLMSTFIPCKLDYKHLTVHNNH